MPGSILRRVAPSVLALTLATALAGPASAASGTLDAYSPAPTPDDDFALSRPTDLGHGRFGALLTFDYAKNPLVWEDKLGDASSERLSVVDSQLVGTAGLSLGLWNRLVLFGGVPAVLVMSGASGTELASLGPSTADGGGLGDVSLGARVRLLGELKDTFALGLQTALTLPTSKGHYSGEQGVSVVPLLSGELRLGGDARLVLLAGSRFRQQSLQPGSNVEFSNELRLGAGVSVPVWKEDDEHGSHFDLLAQIGNSSAFRDFYGRESTNLEALGGARLAHRSGFVAGVGAGPGLSRGIGTPDVRIVLNLGWLTPLEPPPPPPPDPCAATPEDHDGFQDDDGCDDPDNDQDGFLDKVDKCPNEPENVNQWQDQDGCPDTIPDTDKDGLLDPNDKCPAEPEDVDTFEDEDGCPDPDNDKDGVLDVTDKCPMVPGPVENRGCPDTDRDTDTVIDRKDNCPDVPGDPANYGCPKKQKQAVFIEGSAIEILDTIYFRTDSDEIMKKSFPLLDNIVAVLAAHPELEHVRVEGHTDSRGSREHNMELSRKRAASVVNYLAGKNIPRERLESEGYGPDRPVVPDAKTAKDHAKNRRVVFHILGDATDVKATDSGPSSEHIDR